MRGITRKSTRISSGDDAFNGLNIAEMIGVIQLFPDTGDYLA